MESKRSNKIKMKGRIKEALRKLFVKKEEKKEDYVNLDIGAYEEELREEEKGKGGTGIRMYVRTTELVSLHDIPDLKQEIYDGNVVIIDISLLKRDEVALERAMRDLKIVTLDIDGDIASIGDNQVIVTPAGVKIERKKMGKRK
jgi:hypothetical protein